MSAPAPPGGSPEGPVWLRPLLFAIGCLSTGIGIVGLVLPGLPGTVFLIVAAACFTRSSPRFEAWLLDHPRLGPPIRAWRARGAIPRNAKIFASLSLAGSFALLALSSIPLLGKVLCGLMFLGVAGYILTRPSA